MYDDIAFSSENPRPGVIINKPDGEDVYKGVPKVLISTSFVRYFYVEFNYIYIFKFCCYWLGRTTLKKLLMFKTSTMCYLEMKVASQEEMAKL